MKSRPLIPRLLKASDAAYYVGMGETKFRQLVGEGRIAPPREEDGLVLWDVRDLDDYADGLPYRGDRVNDAWDGAAA